jgi:hypothetical protein
MKCKICRSATEVAFTAKVLSKYDTTYFRCVSCGFMQTDDPHWLAEAYTSAVLDIDLGPINRAIVGSRQIEGLILASFDRNASFVDYGGGHGVLVRLMRDRGFDFYWHDRYCENLFAKHFVAKAGQRFELLTAFEVFEHLADPLAEIDSMLGYSGNLLFSTLLLQRSVQTAADWWYLAPEYGQHVAFYTVAALRVIAQRFGLHLSTDGTGLHLLSRKLISNRLFRFLVRDTHASHLTRRFLRHGMRKQSLLLDDFRAVSGFVV